MNQEKIAALCKRLRMFGRRDAYAAANVIEVLAAGLFDRRFPAEDLMELESALSRALRSVEAPRLSVRTTEVRLQNEMARTGMDGTTKRIEHVEGSTE